MDMPLAYHAARTGAALLERHGAAVIECSGPDARTFFHNLCTQEVKNLALGHGAETFLCTAKARVVAHGVVSRLQWQGMDALWFDADPGQAERIFGHLNRYLISEQADLVDRTKELTSLRVVGPAAAGVVAAVCGALPELQPWQHVTLAFQQRPLVIRHQVLLNLPGYDCFVEMALAPSLAEHLIAAGASAADVATHEMLRVEAGWPAYGLDMDENRFAVEVGRTPQAICYTKGCYLGQEPIVMARDRGQVNRLLLGVRCGAGSLLTAGTKLFHGEIDVGQTTSCVHSPHVGEVIALVYLRRGHQEPGTTLTLETATHGREAIVSALPFATVSAD